MTEVERARLEVMAHQQRDDGEYVEAAKTALVIADSYDEEASQTFTPYWRGVAMGLLLEAKKETPEAAKTNEFKQIMEVCRAYEMIYAKAK